MHLTVYLWCLFCLSTYNSLKTYKTLEEKRQKTKRAFSLHCTIYLVGWFWVQGGGGCSGLLWRHSVFALKLCNFSVNFFLSLAKTALSYSLFLLQYFTKYRQCFLKWLFFNSGKCNWHRRITHCYLCSAFNPTVPLRRPYYCVPSSHWWTEKNFLTLFQWTLAFLRSRLDLLPK